MNIQDVTPYTYEVPVTVASGQTLSPAIELEYDLAYQGQSGQAAPYRGLTLAAVTTPGTITGTTFKLHVSNTEAGTYKPVYDYVNGADYSFTMAANKFIAIPPALTAGFKFVKIEAGSAQAQDTAFGLVVRRML